MCSMKRELKWKNRISLVGMLFLCALITIGFVVVKIIQSNSCHIETNDLKRTIYGYEVIGENPYIKYSFPNEVDISAFKVRFSGFNTRSLNVRGTWETGSRVITADNLGEVIDVRLTEEEAFSEYVVFEPALETGHFFRNIQIYKSKTEMYIPWFLFVLAVIILFIFLSFKLSSRMALLQRKVDLLFVVVLAILIFFTYFKYITGNSYLIFHDIASDSVLQFYPGYIDGSRRISFYGWGNGWNPRIGLGVPGSSFFPTLHNWFLLFNEDHIPYLLTVSQCIKVFFAGLFCYLYCTEFTKSNWIKWVLALGYAFSTDVIVRGAWHSYGGIAVLLMLWLWLFERGYSRKNAIYVLAGTAVFFLNNNSNYQILFYSFLMAGYIFIRLLTEESDIKNFFSFLFQCFSGMILIVALCGFVKVKSGISAVSSSQRFNSITPPIFSDIKELITGFARSISTDLIGISANYRGAWDYLEDLSLYSGILVFLLVPICLFSLKGRKRIVTMMLYIAAAAYLLLGNVRYMANGLGTMSWKTSSTWIIALNIYTICLSWNDISRIIKKKWVFNVTALITIAILSLLYFRNYISSAEAFCTVITLIIGYVILFNILIRNNNSNISIKLLLTAMVCAEVVTLSYNSVNNRYTLTNNDFDKKSFYDDYTVDALESIKADKMIDAFRINKQYSSYGMMVGFCESLAQSYMDSKCYVGGTGASPSINEIVDAYRLPNEGYHRLIYGSGMDRYFDAMIGTKYIFSHNDNLEYYSYKLAGSIGDVYIYENTNALPFVFCYDSVIDKSEFETLNTWQRSQIAISACVTETDCNLPRFEINTLVDESGLDEIEIHEEDGILVFDEPKCSVMAKVVFENEGEPFTGAFGYRSNGNTYFYKIEIPSGYDEVLYEIPSEAVDAVIMTGETVKCVKEVHCYEAGDEYYSRAYKPVEKRKQTSMDILYQDDNNLIGTLSVDRPQILFASMPYDSGWHILVDGEEQKVIKVNNGFIGCKLEKGEHNIKIYFEVQHWFIANIGQIIVVLIIIGLAVLQCVVRGTRKLSK